MMVLHCLLKCAHHFYYSQDGVGSMGCEMFAHILLIFSRITVVTILIAFGFGWQVIYENTINIKKKIQYIYIFVLMLAAYDDYSLTKWIEEHPADLFHLMQSDIQWTFYVTKFIEFGIFSFAVWRSLRVNRKNLNEQTDSLEADQATDKRELEVAATINNSIFDLREMFFQQLWVLGTVFLLSSPVSTTICKEWVSESQQQMFQTVCVMTAQLVVYLYLLYMMTNKSSKYYGATFRNQSILPSKIS
mmetsp:Transcript_24215/g.37302  ORF Transcript_24215/g.37302 Transcript_24215/m.37302 type:complete len:246 (-) Transcript_24215:20-757(-)